MGFIDREKASANKLFVEAAELVKNRDADSLEEALSKLYEIIRCYPHTALVVKLPADRLSRISRWKESIEKRWKLIRI